MMSHIELIAKPISAGPAVGRFVTFTLTLTNGGGGMLECWRFGLFFAILWIMVFFFSLGDNCVNWCLITIYILVWVNTDWPQGVN